MKGCLVVVGIVVALLAIAVVVVLVSFARPMHEGVRTLTVPHVSGTGLRAETANGAITVRRGDSAQVEITATVKATSEERLAEFGVRAERAADGVLAVTLDWPGGNRKSREGCRLQIAVPEGVVGVNLSSSNGAIEIDGLGGEAQLATSNGSITVRSHAGDLTAVTSNGRIEASEIAGAVTAKSSNGAVHVSLGASSAGPVEISTSNGSVDLELGAAFTGTLTLSTSNGRIETGAAAGATVTEQGRHRAQLTIGDNPAISSSVSTSNGSIKVRCTAPVPTTTPPPAGDPPVER